ncbi:hypothetical protein [Shewanella sp.]|uniref:hypothetical protein n=1 Tax=Shewanella sp. TaxID=50422 RepID=UPI0035630274
MGRILFIFVSFLLLNANTSVAFSAERDYVINAFVYNWYGKLDTGRLPTDMMTADASIALPEIGDTTPQSLAHVGAHHILSIKTQSLDEALLPVDVTLEYLPLSATGLSRGHYLEVRLYLEPGQLTLSRLETLVHEEDDFDSNYRSASELNLIRAMIFNWTAQLDNPDTQCDICPQIGVTTFEGAERGAKNANAYLAKLSTLGHSQSRREIKNLIITPATQPNNYSVSFEYQWRATNTASEQELAQIAVQMQVIIENGTARVMEYHESYLPPVTDLGAEIRC